MAREKMRLCPKCGISLEYIPEQGYCCPRGHGCWWPADREEKIIKQPASAIYAGGAVEFKGGSKTGKKRKKPVRKIPDNIFDRP